MSVQVSRFSCKKHLLVRYISAASKVSKQLLLKKIIFFFISICEFIDHISENSKEQSIRVSDRIHEQISRPS